MKTSILILAAGALEVPWPVIVILGVATLVVAWLILRKGFTFHFKGRDEEFKVSTQRPSEKVAKEAKVLPQIPPAPKS